MTNVLEFRVTDSGNASGSHRSCKRAQPASTIWTAAPETPSSIGKSTARTMSSRSFAIAETWLGTSWKSTCLAAAFDAARQVVQVLAGFLQADGHAIVAEPRAQAAHIAKQV